MMGKARFQSASAGLLALVGVACVAAYIASPVHAPLFTDEGEVSAAVYTGTTNMDVQGGVALTENLALLVDASLAFSASRYAFGGGGGYSTTLGDIWRLDLYGGFAGGPTAGTEPGAHRQRQRPDRQRRVTAYGHVDSPLGSSDLRVEVASESVEADAEVGAENPAPTRFPSRLSGQRPTHNTNFWTLPRTYYI